MNPDLRQPCAPPGDTTIDEPDPQSSRRLRTEIDELRERGIDVQVAPPDDPAYENRGRIAEVYRWLDGIDDVIEDARQAKFNTINGYAPFGHSPVVRRLSARRVNAQLDRIRADLLYDVVEAVPWWRVGGSALALGTIVDAFQMTHSADDAEGDDYTRMSGRITESILPHRFDGAVPELCGMPLEAATAHMYRYFGVKGILLPKPSQMVRERVAGEKMANLGAFVHARNTKSFLDVVRYCQDGIGIRERARMVNEQIIEYVTERDLHEPVLLSLGSGTTFPILDCVEALVTQGRAPHLIAVDQDPLSLAAAQQEIARRGLKDHVELHCRPVFGPTGRIMDFGPLLRGVTPDVVENSGFREYVPDGVYDSLLRVIHDNLSGGGLSINCCTNENRPQKHFLYGAMGWPVDIRRCELQEMLDAILRSGMPLDATTATVARSGVYTMFATAQC